MGMADIRHLLKQGIAPEFIVARRPSLYQELPIAAYIAVIVRLWRQRIRVMIN
jgi:hypothetical protein